MSWQDIPSLVEARDASGTHKIQLSDRFQELIDMVAMRRGLAGTDEYLEAWRKSRPAEREGSAAEAAQSLAAEIETRYDEIRAAALAGLQG
ncbi:virulence factor [Microbaculum marinum]|uniref:Virulence factor n=1 Tax=Microbaculum marinum TaxID=1764581 RepID=A0AAW9RW99_9HYPH